MNPHGGTGIIAKGSVKFIKEVLTAPDKSFRFCIYNRSQLKQAPCEEYGKVIQKCKLSRVYAVANNSREFKSGRLDAGRESATISPPKSIRNFSTTRDERCKNSRAIVKCEFFDK